MPKRAGIFPDATSKQYGAAVLLFATLHLLPAIAGPKPSTRLRVARKPTTRK